MSQLFRALCMAVLHCPGVMGAPGVMPHVVVQGVVPVVAAMVRSSAFVWPALAHAAPGDCIASASSGAYDGLYDLCTRLVERSEGGGWQLLTTGIPVEMLSEAMRGYLAAMHAAAMATCAGSSAGMHTASPEPCLLTLALHAASGKRDRSCRGLYVGHGVVCALDCWSRWPGVACGQWQ